MSLRKTTHQISGLSATSLRPYILLTLSHAEKRNVELEMIIQRIRDRFECKSIIVAKESHENEGYHFHVGI